MSAIQKRFAFGKDVVDLCALRNYIDNPTPTGVLSCQIRNQPELVIESWENVSMADQTSLINVLSAKGWVAIN